VDDLFNEMCSAVDVRFTRDIVFRLQVGLTGEVEGWSAPAFNRRLAKERVIL